MFIKIITQNDPPRSVVRQKIERIFIRVPHLKYGTGKRTGKRIRHQRKPFRPKPVDQRGIEQVLRIQNSVHLTVQQRVQALQLLLPPEIAKRDQQLIPGFFASRRIMSANIPKCGLPRLLITSPSVPDRPRFSERASSEGR